MLTDKQIWDAWDSPFDKPVNFDHKPTAEELILLRIKAVIIEAVKEERERILQYIKYSIPTFRDVEKLGECATIIAHIPISDWQALKGGKESNNANR